MKDFLTEDEEIETIEYFEDYQNANPELWVAKNAHRIYCGDLRINTFRNKTFQKWVYEVFDIMEKEDLDELRKKLLTSEEIKEIQDEIDAEFE